MLAYVNGEFVPDEEASVSIRDSGFLLADGVFDCWRTYGGRTIRKVAERNLERLRRGINYLELPGDEVVKQVDVAAAELEERNREEIEGTGDVWVFPVVTRGVGLEDLGALEPTIVVMINPIPFDKLYQLEWYESGVHLVSSLMPRNPFLPVDPRVKSISRLAYIRGLQKALRTGPRNWVVLFDDEGYITEAVAAALCLVEGDMLVHSPHGTMLPSINLELFCELGEGLGFEVEQRRLTLFDYLNADEVYVLATGFGAYPVLDMDGAAVKQGRRVGSQIMRAWVEYVGFDFTKEIYGRTASGASAASAVA